MALLQHSVTFFVLEIVVGVIFAVGLIGNVAFWVSGAIAPGRASSVGSVISTLASSTAALLKPPALREFLLDSLLQRRLYRRSRLRWVAHMGLLSGMAILFFVGSLGLMLAERGVLPIQKDDPWFALTNDFAGALIIVAVVFMMSRRFILRERQLRNGAEDVVAIVLMAAIVITGYLLEASRLAVQQVPDSIGWYSFIGYPLSLGFHALALDRGEVEVTLWWTHVILGMSFVAYLPYGKFLHIIATPLTIAANTPKRGSFSLSPNGKGIEPVLSLAKE